MKHRILPIFLSVVVGVILCIPFTKVFAVMTSSNYKINIDAVDGGGVRSTSTSYFIEDTVGEVGTGLSSSTNYALNAGYQQVMSASAISISAPVDVSMPAVVGLGGGFSTSSIVWTVTTDNTAGYMLSIVASTSPALQATSTNSFFTDYVPAGADPDFAFSVPSASSSFGFTPEGTDILSRFKDNGSACNVGSSNTADACWVGFSTSAINVAQSATPNSPSGTATTINMRVEIGSSKIQDSGAYSATLTVTAVVL